MNEPGPIMTADQCRGARGILKIGIVELAHRAGVGHPAIVRIEADAPKVRPSTVAKVQAALEEAGAEFTGTRWVARRRKP
jgi:predicted transcriptional regulator